MELLQTKWFRVVPWFFVAAAFACQQCITPEQRIQAEEDLKIHLEKAAELMFNLGLKRTEPPNHMKARADHTVAKFVMQETEE